MSATWDELRVLVPTKLRDIPTTILMELTEICKTQDVANISKEECKENLSCVWDKQNNVCISAEDAPAPDAVGDTDVPTPTTPGTLFPTAAAGGDSVDDGSDNAGVGLLPEVDCSIFANKDVCNEDPFCFWNKAVCQDATLSPTSDTSTPPTPASYDAPVSSELLCPYLMYI